MKTFFPWLLVILFAGSLFFVFQKGHEKDEQIAALQKQAAEIATLRAELQELREFQASPAEIERLKKENLQVFQLRNQVSQLQKDAAKLRQSQKSLSSEGISALDKSVNLSPDQIQQLIEENRQLRNEAQEFQIVQEREVGNRCINYLRQLDGATDQWALENKKNVGDAVTANDISPYLKSFPACPSGGAYTIGPVGTSPTCSIPGHVLPQ